MKVIAASIREEISELLEEGYLSFSRIAEKYTRYGVTRDDVELQWREMQEMRDVDDSMDGDFDSAMTSAGYGTDEDYGYTPDNE